MSLQTRFQALVERLNKGTNSSPYLETDRVGTLLTSQVYRYFVDITPGDDLPGGPCDAIFATAAGAVEVIGSENEDSEPCTVQLVVGENRVSVSQVTTATGLVAAYIRRPPAA